MMDLSIFGFEQKILFKKSLVNVLYIQNQKLFSNILDIFNKQINFNEKENNEIVLNSEGSRVDLDKNMYIIFDFFNIEYNSKKILSNIYLKISKNFKLKENLDIEESILCLRNIIIQEINELPFEFTMKSSLEIEDLLKLFLVKVDSSCYTTIIEKIQFIIDLLSEFKNANILILPNLKRFLNYNELVELYKYSNYKEINLFLIENGNPDNNVLLYEKVNIIDENFYEY